MKLYIRVGSLAKFQDLFDTNEFLRIVLGQTKFNVYFIETDDKEELREIKRLLDGNRIKYDIKDD